MKTEPTAVAEYSPIAAGLAECRNRYAGVVYDLRTIKGNDEARKARRELVTLRTRLEETRKELKAPLLERTRLIDAEAKRITAELMSLEDPIDAQIKADEQRREEERRRKAEAERVRVNGIRIKIEGIRGLPASMAGMSAAAIIRTIGTLDKLDPGEEFAEFVGDAEAAKTGALFALREMLDRQTAHEAEVMRLAEERAELERQRVAEAARQAEEERKAQEARKAEEELLRQRREAEEARLKAERASQEEAARVERERLAAEEARLKAEREAQEAERKRIEAERAAIERQKREAEEAERKRAEEAARQARLAEGPGDGAIVTVLCEHYGVSAAVVIGWLRKMNLDAASAAANT